MTTQICVRGTLVMLQLAHSSASFSCTLVLLFQAKANEYYQQAMAAAVDKERVLAAVDSVKQLLKGTSSQKQRNKFEKLINPEFKGKVNDHYIIYSTTIRAPASLRHTSSAHRTALTAVLRMLHV
jgi:hypothetical protein